MFNKIFKIISNNNNNNKIKSSKGFGLQKSFQSS